MGLPISGVASLPCRLRSPFPLITAMPPFASPDDTNGRQPRIYFTKRDHEQRGRGVAVRGGGVLKCNQWKRPKFHLSSNCKCYTRSFCYWCGSRTPVEKYKYRTKPTYMALVVPRLGARCPQPKSPPLLVSNDASRPP